MENPEVDRELASDETPDPIAISAEPKEEGHSSQKELLLEGQKQGLLQNVKNFFTGKDENRVSTLTPRPHPRRQWQDPQELEDALHKAEQATRQCRKLQIDLVAYKKHCKSLKESLNSSDQVAEAQLGQIARYQDEHTRLSSEIAVLEQWRRETQETLRSQPTRFRQFNCKIQLHTRFLQEKASGISSIFKKDP
ncbi:hypothetical protein BLS_001489 [Venturia inaequalis]|uniref:Uncharacterized protein n=1 Tax=Venturia inaequalis TaxID=5025 RepID=A0A8H3U1U3_VENIN|nr:hypothetical protein BLS_001489 [Venturia inaequalis]